MYVLFFGIAGEREPDAGTEVSTGHNVEGEFEESGVDH